METRKALTGDPKAHQSRVDLSYSTMRVLPLSCDRYIQRIEKQLDLHDEAGGWTEREKRRSSIRPIEDWRKVGHQDLQFVKSGVPDLQITSCLLINETYFSNQVSDP